ncbi:hypothetical protein D3C81_1503930 [compost metagenome]
MRQFAVGKHVAVDELAAAAADRPTIGVLGGDAVVQHQAAGSDGLLQGAEVQWQVGVADVLEHADADHLVEAPVRRQVAVVLQLQLHAILQALGRHPLARQLELLAAEGDAVDLGTELTGGKARQPTPAATDVQQPLTGLQTQLAAQVTQFGLLGSIQVFRAGLEVGAGIDHVTVQPQPVEVV